MPRKYSAVFKLKLFLRVPLENFYFAYKVFVLKNFLADCEAYFLVVVADGCIQDLAVWVIRRHFKLLNQVHSFLAEDTYHKAISNNILVRSSQSCPHSIDMICIIY